MGVHWGKHPIKLQGQSHVRLEKRVASLRMRLVGLITGGGSVAGSGD